MRKTFLLQLLFVICIQFNASSQTDTSSVCPCCTEAHDEFDFWLGSWEVRDSTGQVIGFNELTKLEKNCVLKEQWQSALGGTGTSNNYYNPSDSTWNQLWLSDSGTILELKGKFENGKMALYSDWQPGQQVERYRNRITWEPLPNGSVLQSWDILGENDSLLVVAFKGYYFKK